MYHFFEIHLSVFCLCRFQQMQLGLLNTEHIHFGPRSIVLFMSMMEHPVAVAVSEWRWGGWNRTMEKPLCVFSKILVINLYKEYNFDLTAAPGYKIYCPWWWSKALSWVLGLCNNGYESVSAPLLWHTRILWRAEYESGAESSFASGWETSTEWGYGWRETCNYYLDPSWHFFSFHYCISIFILIPSEVYITNIWFSSLLPGLPPHAWDKRTLPFWGTNYQHCKEFKWYPFLFPPHDFGKQKLLLTTKIARYKGDQE